MVLLSGSGGTKMWFCEGQETWSGVVLRVRRHEAVVL